MKYRKVKNKIINTVFNKLKKNKNILSASFVGSFVDNANLKKINDIDLIIVLKKLNQKSFNSIKGQINNLNLSKFFPKKKIFINDTFGPLKFNSSKLLVIHLMIYDYNGHIEHSIKSPFTVYDWERSKNYFNQSLSSLFSTGNIQLVDFINSRRGILNYLRDIKNKKISYRVYKFSEKKFKIVRKNINLKERDKFEFYFHVVKNLLLNFFKFKSNKNKLFSLKINDKKIKKYIGNSFYNKHHHGINKIIEKKRNLDFSNEKKLDSWIINFIKDFQKKILNLQKNSKKITFIRHAKTSMNDGSFLGQKRNPSIEIINYKIKREKYSKIYSSPMNRCIETVKIISKQKKYVTNNNLLEIDYGKLEGLDIIQIKKKYPDLIRKWLNGKDPKFPKGENQNDVVKRIKIFIDTVKRNNSINTCVISHNVFLRCLIGIYFKIRMKNWYKINIPHLMKLEFIIIGNNIYPNIDRKKLKIIFSNLY